MWGGRQYVLVRYPDALDLDIRIPVDFIAKGGDNTLAFVQYLAQMLVEEKGVLRDSSRPAVDLDLDAEPQNKDLATYCFLPVEVATFTESRGPQSACQIDVAPPGEDENDGASSVYSRNSAEQTSFKFNLVSRDSWCPFTKSKPGACDAAHLVPAARLDVYRALLGVDSPYEAGFGMLMDESLHKQYGRYKWSLYHKDDKYYFHTFHPSDKQLLKDCHGKAYAKADMRVLEDEDYPNPALCEWHYRQCVMMRLRGYSTSDRPFSQAAATPGEALRA
ncbi:hypothetical protein Rt10032_c10g4375 [Rhodotorula toruloides]|uniref:HNH nuclease domain-containing protein n=1 Tax=Rhodotorula toruloides TaxID=5286 RepID=A0A511KIZ1_RHOTO|nr:hypothetical protein Rt10032_c10g4375 [Rhodotorula toruloides]